jgi:hypothetical protein
MQEASKAETIRRTARLAGFEKKKYTHKGDLLFSLARRSLTGAGSREKASKCGG